MSQAPYDIIADEYYDSFHKTCRNFDETTIQAIKSLKFDIPKNGLLLEVGAGRGRAKEFLNIDSNRVIQLDNSIKMLNVKPRENCLIKVFHCAEKIPFDDKQFSCVISFLCDPFLGLNFLSEAFRVLKDNGLFLATIPSYEWGSVLREEINININETRFFTKKNKTIHIPSVLVRSEKLIEMLNVVGFQRKDIKLTKHNLPKNVNIISIDIITAAQKSGCNKNELPILDIILALKKS